MISIVFYLLSSLLCSVYCDECILLDKGPHRANKEELLKTISFLSNTR